MDISSILMYVITALVGLGAWVMKSHLERLSDLEKKLPEKVTESEVRLILDDKIEPIKEKLSDLSSKIDRILELLLSK